MKLKTILRLLAVFVALATFAAGCSSDNKTAAEDSKPAQLRRRAQTPQTSSSWAAGTTGRAALPSRRSWLVSPSRSTSRARPSRTTSTAPRRPSRRSTAAAASRSMSRSECLRRQRRRSHRAVLRPQQTEDKNMVAGLASTYHAERGRRLPALRDGGPAADRRAGDPAGGLELAGELRVHHGRLRHAPGEHAGAQVHRRQEVRDVLPASGQVGRSRRSPLRW